MLAEALDDAAVAVRRGARGLVLAREGWHAGVVGIVAARVAERFHRPAVLIGVDGGEGKGSGRSIEGFHLHEALQACQAHLVRFGGHRHAAGLTIAASEVERFRAAFEAHAAGVLQPEDLVARCRVDAWVAAGDLSPRAAEDLERLGPFGAGHPEPVFAFRAQATGARTVGAGAAHLKLSFGRGLDAIGFSMGDRAGLCQGPVEAAFTLGFDDWDGTRRLQLKLRDLRAAS
jgi:single-stranded-DNA-specific exonuclease